MRGRSKELVGPTALVCRHTHWFRPCSPTGCTGDLECSCMHTCTTNSREAFSNNSVIDKHANGDGELAPWPPCCKWLLWTTGPGRLGVRRIQWSHGPELKWTDGARLQSQGGRDLLQEFKCGILVGPKVSKILQQIPTAARIIRLADWRKPALIYATSSNLTS